VGQSKGARKKRNGRSEVRCLKGKGRGEERKGGKGGNKRRREPLYRAKRNEELDEAKKLEKRGWTTANWPKKGENRTGA